MNFETPIRSSLTDSITWMQNNELVWKLLLLPAQIGKLALLKKK